MYILLKKDELRKIVLDAIKKEGSIRRLEKKIEIPRSTIGDYVLEKRIINEKNLEKFLSYLKISLNQEYIIEKYPDNWRQITGGKKSVESKKKKGTFEKQIKKCQKHSSIYMKLFHKKMKKQNPEEYHILQYQKFKKIGNYKLKTNNGEIVRNNLEKETANLLKEMNLDYIYEPLIRIKNKYYFPDFLINNKIIIECTEWKGYDKAFKLKEKIYQLSKKYKVYVFIPKTLKRYYEMLNNNLVLGFDELKTNLLSSRSSAGRAFGC